MYDEEEEQGVQCPYCWAFAPLPIDDQDVGEMIIDCDVCCQPWLVRVVRDQDGVARVTVERAQ